MRFEPPRRQPWQHPDTPFPRRATRARDPLPFATPASPVGGIRPHPDRGRASPRPDSASRNFSAGTRPQLRRTPHPRTPAWPRPQLRPSPAFSELLRAAPRCPTSAGLRNPEPFRSATRPRPRSGSAPRTSRGGIWPHPGLCPQDSGLLALAPWPPAPGPGPGSSPSAPPDSKLVCSEGV